MAIIDADAHVVESEKTWSYMDGAEKRFRPSTVVVPNSKGDPTESWVVDGRVMTKGPIEVDDLSRALREMGDIPARLSHMDKLGTDVQVLYPTLFLFPITEKPEVEAALYRSYNRWLADIWKQGNGRFRWAVMVPPKS